MHLDTQEFRDEMEGILERLHRSPLPKDGDGESSVKEKPLLTPEQRRLLGVLDLVLDLWKVKDPKTAETVGVSFGLVDRLCSVKPEESVILNVGCGHSQVQLELRRLRSPVPVPPGPLDCMHWCPFPPPGHCCLTIFSGPLTSNLGRS